MKQFPLLFIGHGSPMNALETNDFTTSWKEMVTGLEKPKAILIFSAHWSTRWETLIGGMDHPDMIYDMYGFPDELYQVRYPVPGSHDLVKKITGLVPWIRTDEIRWLDHGIWSLLIHMFPGADIPVIPLSLDYEMDPKKLFELGRLLRELRDQGVLIIGSGNIVHNLRMIDWSNNRMFPWAQAFDEKVATLIASRDFWELFRFKEWGDITHLAHPTYDHLLPLFPLLGATYEGDIPRFSTPQIVMGSISMRSVRWG